jgi:transmembrane sensor
MEKVINFPDGPTMKQQAAEWLIKLDGDSVLSPEELQSLREWLARSPAHREQLFRLAELWNEMNVLSELAVPLDSHTQHDWSTWLRPSRIIATAAMILAAVGLIIFIDSESPVDSNGLYATAVGQQSLITLSDGSTVNLNTDSQIRVNYGDEYRDVYLLRGEAHFSVTDDREMPFRVLAGGDRIRALGTAFSVYIRDGTVDVTVSEGSVVLERIGPAEIPLVATAAAPAPTVEPQVKELGTLRAGQVATISSLVDEAGETDSLRNFGSIEPPEMLRRLSWTEGVLLFSGESLEEVVREISRYTVAEIEFADPEVGAIRIGGRFPVGETETMFDTLENAFGLRVTRSSEDHVLISAGD